MSGDLWLCKIPICQPWRSTIGDSSLRRQSHCCKLSQPITWSPRGWVADEHSCSAVKSRIHHNFEISSDCRKLYEWHDGAKEPLELIPGYTFLSLAQAIEEYRLQLEIAGGTEGYNPLWFPVYLSFNEDTEIRMMFSDFRALLAVLIQCFETGAYRIDEDFLIEDENRVERIRAEFGDAAPTTHVDGTNSFSSSLHNPGQSIGSLQ